MMSQAAMVKVEGTVWQQYDHQLNMAVDDATYADAS
jgi:hypothetical protein